MPDIVGKVGVMGATSLVGDCILSRLAQIGCDAVAFSREQHRNLPGNTTDWRQITEPASQNIGVKCSIPYWICATPIWVVPEYFQMLESYGVRKVVALSSTSRFTKDLSADLEEQQLAKRLADAESRVQCWAEDRGVEWVILRPTLIYGLGKDKNVSEIARFIDRFGFFPLFGEAQGMRQPIHAEDVAAACVSALQTFEAANRAYSISGGETLTYRDMVVRVFAALDRHPRLLNVPFWMFCLVVTVVSRIPRYRHWSAAMVARMNSDLVFDHSEAASDFGFKPRGFSLPKGNLP